MFRFKLIGIGLILGITMLAAGCGGKPSFDGAIDFVPTPEGDFELATPAAPSPAAGICAEFNEDVVTVSIHPDIPDPRCSIIHPDQMLKVINNRDDILTIRIGHLEASLAPGASHLFDLRFGEYLAPGVHRIEVQPCCGAELVLGELRPNQ